MLYRGTAPGSTRHCHLLALSESSTFPIGEDLVHPCTCQYTAKNGVGTSELRQSLQLIYVKGMPMSYLDIRRTIEDMSKGQIDKIRKLN
jgi:hypothetical protein